MDNTKHIDPETIGEHYIDIEKVLGAKGVKLPKFVTNMVGRLLHVKELNRGIYKYRYLFGLDFVHAFFDNDLKIDLQVVSPENIPSEGYPIIAANHPLGGPDGLALIRAVGDYRQDIQFPVTDFLMYLPGMRPLFVPVNKVHKLRQDSNALEEAFAGENALLYFPAGLCSRKKGGVIHDLEWKPTFIKKAVRYKRDIVPVYFEAKLRKRFYFLANLRERLGVKFNFEMALLPSEMFAQKGKTMRLVVGKPISYQVFDDRYSAKEWAAKMQEYVYKLKDNPGLEFNV